MRIAVTYPAKSPPFDAAEDNERDEIERRGDDISVIAAPTGPREVLASRTVLDLVAGPGLLN